MVLEPVTVVLEPVAVVLEPVTVAVVLEVAGAGGGVTRFAEQPAPNVTGGGTQIDWRWR